MTFSLETADTFYTDTFMLKTFFVTFMLVSDPDCLGSEQRGQAGVQAVLGRGPGRDLHTLGEGESG